MLLAWLLKPLEIHPPPPPPPVQCDFLTRNPRPRPRLTPGPRVCAQKAIRSGKGYRLSLGPQGQGLVATMDRRNSPAAFWRAKLARRIIGMRLTSGQIHTWIRAGRARNATGDPGWCPLCSGDSGSPLCLKSCKSTFPHEMRHQVVLHHPPPNPPSPGRGAFPLRSQSFYPQVWGGDENSIPRPWDTLSGPELRCSE